MFQQISFEEFPIVPAGKVRLAEYGNVPAHHMAQREVISSAETTEERVATFSYSTRGYVCAGSMLRWQEARWSVLVEIDGATHGQNFSDTEAGEDAARALFAKWTDPVAVAAAKIERAEMDAKVAVVQAEMDAENRACYLEACASRGLNPNTKKARRMFSWYRGR